MLKDVGIEVPRNKIKFMHLDNRRDNGMQHRHICSPSLATPLFHGLHVLLLLHSILMIIENQTHARNTLSALHTLR